MEKQKLNMKCRSSSCLLVNTNEKHDNSVLWRLLSLILVYGTSSGKIKILFGFIEKIPIVI